MVHLSFEAGCGIRLYVCEEHREIGPCNHSKEGHGDHDGHPLVPYPSVFQRIGHRHIAIDGDAAQEKDANVDVAEEDVPCHLARGKPHHPFMVILHINDPERDGAQV